MQEKEKENNKERTTGGKIYSPVGNLAERAKWTNLTKLNDYDTLYRQAHSVRVRIFIVIIIDMYKMA